MMVILFAMAVGYGADRLGWLDPETDTKLSNLALNITIPSLVLSTVMTGEELPPKTEAEQVTPSEEEAPEAQEEAAEEIRPFVPVDSDPPAEEDDSPFIEPGDENE